MSTRTLRSASAATTDLSCGETLAVDGSMMCAICLEAFDPNDMSGVATLPCAHKFCATCLVPHLLKDPRCPCCRNLSPGYIHPENLEPGNSSIWDYPEEFDDEEEGISVKTAIREARKLRKTDKRISKLCQTLRKWELARTAARKKMKDLANTLSPLEDKVEDKIQKYSDKLWDAFDANNQTLIDDLEQSKKDHTRAVICWSQSRMRLAKKGGFVPYRRSWRRGTDVDDDVEDGLMYN